MHSLMASFPYSLNAEVPLSSRKGGPKRGGSRSMDKKNLQPRRVLIVEDELIVAADLEDTLHHLGFDVVGTAGDVEQAIAIASQARPDLILTDIQLHGKPSGFQLAEDIRRSFNIPVMFLTAYAKEDFMQRARATAAYGFLSKPFRAEDLKAAILIALEQHRLGQELFAANNWLVTMLASIRDGVIATDASGLVRYLNPAGEYLTGWSSEEAFGKPIEEIYSLTDLNGANAPEFQLRRALAERKPIPKARFWMKKHGDDFLPVEDSAAPIIQDGHLLGAVTIFLDISDRLSAEAEQRTEQHRLQREVQVTTAALGQTKEELRALSGRLIAAQEDERRRVARELHDDFGQRAALMSWRVAELRKITGKMSATAQKEVDLLQEELNRLASGLRDVSHQLHPSVVADLVLAAALGEIVEQHRAQGVDVSIVTRELPGSIPAELGTGLYRIAQEALRNAVQHAPEAPVLITLSFDAGVLQLKIEDPGPGFDLGKVRETGGGLGLLSIQERARLLGGVLVIRTAPDEGPEITVRLPVA
jgi:PAS domain S-box-containing protein